MRTQACTRCKGLMTMQMDAHYRDEHNCNLYFWRCIQCSATVWVKAAEGQQVVGNMVTRHKRLDVPVIEVHRDGERMGGWLNSVRFNYPRVKAR